MNGGSLSDILELIWTFCNVLQFVWLYGKVSTSGLRIVSKSRSYFDSSIQFWLTNNYWLCWSWEPIAIWFLFQPWEVYLQSTETVSLPILSSQHSYFLVDKKVSYTQILWYIKYLFSGFGICLSIDSSFVSSYPYFSTLNRIIGFHDKCRNLLIPWPCIKKPVLSQIQPLYHK